MSRADADSPLDLRQLRYVVALAESAHFGRAARQLRIAQPALSQQVRRLEEALGYALFERRPRVVPTAAGAVFVDAARRAIAQAEHGVEAARRLARGEAGVLRVGYAPSTVPAVVPRILRAFRHAHPDVELRLLELPSAEQVDALRDGAIDVGFVREAALGGEVVGVPVARERYLAALPPRHPLTRRRFIPVAALADEPFVLFPREAAPPLYDQILSLCRGAGFVPRVVQEALVWVSIVGLVDAGLGVALVPESFRRLRWGDVQYRPLRPAGPWTATHLCHLAAGAPAAAAALVRLARQHATL